MELNGAKILYTIHTNIPLLGDFKITQTLVSTWIVMALLSGFAIWLGHDLKLENVSKRQAAAEFIVTRLEQFVHDNMGFHFDQYIPLVGAIFALSIGCNLISVVGLWSPTADLNTEAAWAIVVFVLIIMITHITEIPAAIVTIVKSAFTGSALAGGAMGTMVVAMQKGIARGIFSNEAGLGSAPIAAAAAVTKEPVRQGLVSMTGTFIDTIIICTMTGISVVLAGTWNDPNLEGVEITMAAFQKGLPFAPAVASFILMLCLVFFAFTTILGWNYYGERCMEYLFNRNKKVVMTYRWLYILAVFIGPYMTVAAVWNIADIFNALMALPNLIALLVLSNVVVKETKDYFARMK